MTFIKCPTCQRQTEWSPENKWRPFCCERCKLIDLGDWAAEKHAIPAVDDDNDRPQEFTADG
ncbi:MAG: DNA gyrase inhibitor YacG [Steroidobacteraceae bacterium]